ncbi:TBC1 domain family member 13 isoform X2 [Bombus vosnesenskii]|uniref:TBC1 domain family member 13 n=4 Tax=Bombus TaxID=28641 RepID=A0A6J3K9L0_9HYME|nr:TBC1 domain family member 13 isoform X2 [Bombus impatiens]XP_033190051.1 TBC1 domain family member 13 isoform X2 [Bombus vancouverensis nearcticus]XP_033348739.1 TBC1 domain family member 13 isoform X2 [Bombus vosnesenskii]XP_048266037.1 TBC1 domain family member 13 isoform X2 [Bombus terrestris]
MSILRKRLYEFDDALNAEEIDLINLKRLCFHGIPDEGGLRPLCWKLLLNYLPSTRASWSETLIRKRTLYKTFIEDLIVTPGEANSDGERVDVTLHDHPLNLNPDSKWQTYFKDNEVLLQIDKDVRRLCPDISFFQQGTDYPRKEIVNANGQRRLHHRVQHTVLRSANVERKGLGITKQIAVSIRKATEDYAPLAEGGEAHWEVLERILFLYAKLNPGQGYVQGMNEIVGPIYHAFACDPDQNWREHAEADTFFCFTNLMSEIRDFFIKSLDEAEFGINSMMGKLTTQVKVNDPEVWMRLHQQELCPQYYSFRWLTLLLSQEFPLPDVMRIWDSLFADENRFSFLIHICCAMILLLRDQLLAGDFATNVKLLQNFPSVDIQIVLSKAAALAGKSLNSS